MPNRCHTVAVKTSKIALFCVFLCYNERMLKKRRFYRRNDPFRVKNGGVAKWESRGLQKRYSRGRFPPPPLQSARIWWKPRPSFYGPVRFFCFLPTVSPGGPAFAGNSGRNTANACEANAMETTTVTAAHFMVGALIRFRRHDK